MTNLNFINSPFFDYGAINQINNILKRHNINRPLICTDPGIIKTDLLDILRNNISNEFSPFIFNQTPANPTEEAVEIAVSTYKNEDCDGVIGFGGGSSLDLAKAVCLMVTHPGSLKDYSPTEGGIEKIHTTAPLIAIPTTSGTGSEVSSGAVIIMNDGRKLVLISKELIPLAAICDPELTLGLPTAMSAGGGMDALTHCIEAILSPAIDPPADGVGLDGIEKIVREGNLIKVIKDSGDREARWNMMMASTEGAMAFTKSAIGFGLGTLALYRNIWSGNIRMLFIFLLYNLHFLVFYFINFSGVPISSSIYIQVVLIHSLLSFAILFVIDKSFFNNKITLK